MSDNFDTSGVFLQCYTFSSKSLNCSSTVINSWAIVGLFTFLCFFAGTCTTDTAVTRYQVQQVQPTRYYWLPVVPGTAYLVQPTRYSQVPGTAYQVPLVPGTTYLPAELLKGFKFLVGESCNVVD